MRTNIDIDDELLQRAMKGSGARTKKAVVEQALKLLVRVQAQTGILKLRGKVKCEGNLDQSRLSRGEE